MVAGLPASPKGGIHPVKGWMSRHENEIIVANSVVLVLLFLIYIAGPTGMPLSLDLVRVSVMGLVGFLFFTVASKGSVPAIIVALGVVLLYLSIIVLYLPSYGGLAPPLFLDDPATVDNREPFGLVITMNFLLGLGMVVFAMVVAYAPEMLYTKNRPEEKESVWSKYPIWHDNVRLVGRYSEPLVPARSLMEERDRYLLWRYEYVLANIYGTPHLVRPDGLVPKKDTEFIRDKDSGLLMGVGRYDGYFV